MQRYLTWTALAIFGLLIVSSVSAIEYKEYKKIRQHTQYFEITYGEEQISITGLDEETSISIAYPRSALTLENGLVYADGDLLFDTDGLRLGERLYYYDSVSHTRIVDDEDEDVVTITFYVLMEGDTKPSRFRRGNRITMTDNIDVDADDFVRGIVFSVAGDVAVSGEVNNDVIAIMGDIYIAPDAVVRGDVAAIRGRVDVSDDASVYGELYYVGRRGLTRRHHFMLGDRDWSFFTDLTYNRVDGLALYGGLDYDDTDSLLPSVWGHVGYGFNSERWRYDVGSQQTLLREPVALSLGAAMYRRLASGDDWILGNHENTAFAVLATEDFKDYYEAEGGTVYLELKAPENVTFESRYRHEKTEWLDARRHLWSLFGGSKLFGENFGTVDSVYREIGIAETDGTTNVSWYNRCEWDTRHEDDPFSESAWHIAADLEWSSPSFKSDFDYRRYTLAARRYQRVNRRTVLVTRFIYGGSDGYLPMYKRFFLGGLGTLRGYRHKEYMGTRFWLANAEYRFNFPRVETAVSLFWDIGQIANERKLDGSVEVKNNIGIALYFEDDVKISLAKRLDRSYGDNPVFYVRLHHVF
ncbi:MAG: BamA/TamA family outer membrane protein [Candidatus Zixiibacteriota bacterium]|nr:MAG: BamA/TamA family outer membrane protein [candidate division Zixibacteria bacterium]